MDDRTTKYHTDAHPDAHKYEFGAPGPEKDLVIFHWSRRHGACYECGCPAAFWAADEEPEAVYDDDTPRLPTYLRRCAICAAEAAVNGEQIGRIDTWIEQHPATRWRLIMDQEDGQEGAPADVIELTGVLSLRDGAVWINGKCAAEQHPVAELYGPIGGPYIYRRVVFEQIAPES